MSKTRSQILFVSISVVYFLTLALLIFGPMLGHSGVVISSVELDIDQNFYAWRQFAFDSLRAGHLPLWNPYPFGGMPALGNIQYALLYPPNWLHMALPTAIAINAIVALHVMLAGLFTSWWCRWRDCGMVASLIGGTLFMFCGPIMMGVYAGHLPFLSVVAWSPLIFLCVDAIIAWKHPRVAFFGGAICVAMQILGGYPQPMFYTLVIVSIYSISLLVDTPNRLRAVGLIIGMYAFGTILSAAQLLPSIEASSESVRSSAHSVAFASSFSLPPENLLTLVLPHIWGNNFNVAYMGRGAMWENSIFLGTTGIVLAAVGFFFFRFPRDRAIALAMLIALVFALGENTRVFGSMLKLIPGLELFRVPARFGFLVTLLLSVLAAQGFDVLWRLPRLTACAIATGISAILAIIFASVIWFSPNIWSKVISWIPPTVRVWEPATLPINDAVLQFSASLARSQLFACALLFGQICIILFLAQKRRTWTYLFLILTIGQGWNASGVLWQTIEPRTGVFAQWQPTLDKIGADDRILATERGCLNLPTQFRVQSIWGYDPLAPARWTNLVSPLLGADPQNVDFGVRQIPPSPIWRMLRLQTTIPPQDETIFRDPLPRISLIANCRVVSSPAQSLRAVQQLDFDPSKVVILEDKPFPPPVIGDSADGGAQVLKSSNESLEIRVETRRPSILLITDGYDSGWRAKPLEDGPQNVYEVMPADHALRAIPLTAGKHHILLEYRPASVLAGAVISIAGMLGWVIACCITFVKHRHRSTVI
ncbi:MAG TPA: YfhO family protein [Tepidisphaeraceae bacterium]|nr:YfhO family protein [Tepidisphaeraceae bacterium]